MLRCEECKGSWPPWRPEGLPPRGYYILKGQPFRHSKAVTPPPSHHPAFRRAGAKGTQGRQKAHRFYGSPFVGREAAEVRAFRQSRISRTEHRDIPKECYGAKNVRGVGCRGQTEELLFLGTGCSVTYTGEAALRRPFGSPFVGREAAEVRAFRQSRISRTEHRDIPKECYGAKNVRGAGCRGQTEGLLFLGIGSAKGATPPRITQPSFSIKEVLP